MAIYLPQNMVNNNFSKIAFEKCKPFFESPFIFLKNLPNKFSETFNSHPLDKMKVIFVNFLNSDKLNITNIAGGLLLFIFCYLVFKKFVVGNDRQQELKFYKKKTMGWIFLSIWIILGAFVFSKIGFNEITMPTLHQAYSFLFSIFIATFCSLLICSTFFLLSYLSEILMAFSILLPVISVILCFIYKYVPTGEQVFFFTLFLILIFILGSMVNLKFNQNLKNTFIMILRNLPHLLLVFILVSSCHYGLISITLSLWKLINTNATGYYFVIFLNTWIHFTISYFITVYISSFCSISKGKGIFSTIKETFSCIDVIINRSLYITIYQIFIVIVDALIQILYKKSNPVLSLLYYLLCALKSCLEWLVIMVDADNINELIKLGSLGIDNYYDDSKNVKIDEEDPKFIRFIFSLFKGTPHLFLSIISIFNLKILINNYNHMFFTMFVAINIFIYFLNTFVIAVRLSKEMDDKKEIETNGDKQKELDPFLTNGNMKEGSNPFLTNGDKQKESNPFLTNSDEQEELNPFLDRH